MSSTLARLSYTIPQFVAETGVPRTATYEAIASGELRSFKVGKRRLISAEAARKFIAKRERATAEGGA